MDSITITKIAVELAIGAEMELNTWRNKDDQKLDSRLALREFKENIEKRARDIIEDNLPEDRSGCFTNRKMDYRLFTIKEKSFSLTPSNEARLTGDSNWGVRYVVSGFPGTRIRHFRTPGEAVEYIDYYLDFSNITDRQWEDERSK